MVKASTAIFKIPAVGWGNLLVLQPPKTSPICKFPCSLNLPATNLEWSASFLQSLLALCARGPVCKSTVQTMVTNSNHSPYTTGQSSKNCLLREWSLLVNQSGCTYYHYLRRPHLSIILYGLRFSFWQLYCFSNPLPLTEA